MKTAVNGRRDAASEVQTIAAYRVSLYGIAAEEAACRMHSRFFADRRAAPARRIDKFIPSSSEDWPSQWPAERMGSATVDKMSGAPGLLKSNRAFLWIHLGKDWTMP